MDFKKDITSLMALLFEINRVYCFEKIKKRRSFLMQKVSQKGFVKNSNFLKAAFNEMNLYGF